MPDDLHDFLLNLKSMNGNNPPVDETNYERYLEQYGPEWMAGYLQAVAHNMCQVDNSSFFFHELIDGTFHRGRKTLARAWPEMLQLQEQQRALLKKAGISPDKENGLQNNPQP